MRIVIAILALCFVTSAYADGSVKDGWTREPPPSPPRYVAPSPGATIQAVPYSAMLMRKVCHPNPGHHGPWHVVLRDCAGCVPDPVLGLKNCRCIDKGTQVIPDRCGWAHGPYGYNLCVDYWAHGELKHTWWYLKPAYGAVPSYGVAYVPTPAPLPQAHAQPQYTTRPAPPPIVYERRQERSYERQYERRPVRRHVRAEREERRSCGPTWNGSSVRWGSRRDC